MDNKTYDLRFQHPFTMQVTGGTGAGKTEAVKKIILNRTEMIHPVPELVTFAYGEYQSAYDNIPDVNFVRGLDESMVSRETLNNKSLLLIIDDLSDEADPKLLSALFTKISHHRSISIIFLLNSIFYKGLGGAMRLISINTQYHLLMKTFRDTSSIATLARQMFGPHQYKYMLDAYLDATKQNFGYLLVDLKPNSPDEIRLRTHIFPGENTICYVIKQNGQIRK